MTVIFWTVLTLALVAVVVFSTQLEFLVPAVAAFLVLLVTMIPGLGENYFLQTALWIVLSVAGFLGFWRRIQKLRQPNGGPAVESVAGKSAVVIEELGDGIPGRVKFQGTTWAAESAYPLPVGAEVEVLSQKGLLLHVIPKKETQ